MALNKNKHLSICKKFLRKYSYEIVIAVIVIIIHEILNSNLYALTQSVGYDEQATLSWTGLLTSSSWRQIIENHNYYGFGFSAFLGVIYYAFKDPVVIYRIILTIISVLYAVSAVIAYKITQTIAHPQKKEDKIFSSILSIAAVFVPVKFVYVINEHIFILINWLLIYLMVKLAEKGKNKLYVICIIILLGYSLTVHEKAITLWVGVIITYLFFKFRFKESAVNLFIAGGSLLAIHGIVKKIISWLRNFFWAGAEKVNSNSSSGTLAAIIEKMSYLKNPYNWIFPIATFLSQIYFITFCTGGVFLAVLLASIYLFFIWGIRNKCEETWKKQILIIIIHTFLCIFITIMVQDITWMPNVSDYNATQVMQEVLGKRAKLYLRYFCCYCGPLVVLFAVYCIRFYDKFKKFFTITLGLYSILSVFESVCISPWYGENRLSGAPIYSMFLPFVFENPNEFLTSSTFIKAIIVSSVIVVVLYILFIKKNFLFLSICITALFVHQYLYTGFTVYKVSSENMYNDNYPVYNLLKDIEGTNVVYMPEMTKKDIRLKFYLTEYSITKASPDLSNSNIIIIVDNDHQVNDIYTQYSYQFFEVGAYEVYLSPDIELNQQ